MNWRRILPLCAIVLGFGCLYGSLRDAVYDVDQIGYIEGARNVLNGKGYVVPKGLSVESLDQAAETDFAHPWPAEDFTREVHPILYGYVLAMFMRLFGTDLSSGALLSGLCALVSMVLIYGTAYRFGGPMPAMLATVLTGVSYFFWRASLAVMTESLCTAFSIAGAVCFLRYLQTECPQWLLATGALYGLATATRPQQVVLVASTGVLYGAIRGRQMLRDWRWLAGAAALFGTALLPQYLYARTDTLLYTRVALFSVRYFWQADPGGDVMRPSWQLIAYLKALLLGGQLVFPAASVLVVFGAYRGVRRKDLVVRFMVLWILGEIALLSVERYFSLRYLAQAVVPAYLIAAYGFVCLRAELGSWLGNQWARPLTEVGLAFLMAGATVVSAIPVVATVRAHNLRAAPYSFLDGEVTDRDIVLGVGDTGRFYHRGPFFPLAEASLQTLGRIVEAARRSERKIFVVLPTQRAARAESEYGEESGATSLRDFVESTGGRRIWSASSGPPLRKWLPQSAVDRLSESWEVYEI